MITLLLIIIALLLLGILGFRRLALWLALTPFLIAAALFFIGLMNIR